MNPRVGFGHGMRRYFQQDEEWINFNHGSHGTFPKQVAEVRADIARRIESAPDRFLRYDYKTLLNESRLCIADYLRVPVDECVLVQNATTALDAVFRNLTFDEKDAILCFETVYDAVEKSILCIQETFPQLSIFKVGYKCAVEYRLPMTHPEIVSLFINTIAALQKDGYRIKAAVFDTVTSIPAVRLPFERLTEICKQHNILSIIDGAHGVGQFPLDLGVLDADFFVSNCHKWLYTPRSCAVLHIPRRNHHLIRNTVPTSFLFVPRSGAFVREGSRGEEASGFVELFQNIATMDNTPLYCIPAALQFRDKVCGGEEAIFRYITQIAQKGADVLAKELDTFVLEPTATSTKRMENGSELSRPYAESRDCAMATIALPLTVKEGQDRGLGQSDDGDVDPAHAVLVASWMQRTLTEYDTTASIFVYDQKFWVRIMGQIYLEVADFEWLAGILKKVCQRVKIGEPFVD